MGARKQYEPAVPADAAREGVAISSLDDRAAALDALGDPIFIMRPVRGVDGSIEDLLYGYVNAAAVALYARPVEEIVGHLQCDLFPSVREMGLLDRYVQTIETGIPGELEIPKFDENGVAGSFMLQYAAVGGDLLVVAQDITLQRSAEQQLAERNEQLRSILDYSLDGIARFGPDLRIEYVNKRAADLSGIPAEEWVGKTYAELGYDMTRYREWEEQLTWVFAHGEPVTFTYEIENLEGSGWWEASLAPEFGPDNTVLHVVSTNRDVTRRVQAERELRDLATHDSLTHLVNRAGLDRDLALSVAAAERTRRPMALLMVGVDRFKVVNDSRGHSVGDRLLQAVAERLVAMSREQDLVARLGGDQFIVVMRDLDFGDEAVSAAWHLVHRFREPFVTSDGELFATLSIGVAVRQGEEDAEALLRNGDAALHAAKVEGRDRVAVFNDDLRAAASARLKIEGELRHALERKELVLWYQPEVDLNTGMVTAAEALLRWRHPDGDILTGERFIDVAEETGLILDIGPWVFEQACRQAAAWARELTRPCTVRVNFSALQLEDAGLLVAMDEAIAATGVNPTMLCAEITETVWLRATEAVRANLEGIRARGLSIAIDDFGTGFAALTYLRRYPVSVLKIDRSFIASITSDERDARLVAGVIALAASVGVEVTAEGVECEAQARVLRDLGCPSSQGFFYSEAVPPEVFARTFDRVHPHG